MIAQVDVSITALAPIKHRFADFADLPAREPAADLVVASSVRSDGATSR
jgi:hypothetical protein